MNTDDPWRHVRGEPPADRLDRTYAEILQEVRVAQTGVQCLLAFVLTLAFTPRFGALSRGELRLYVATLVLAAIAASLLMAPAAFNRMVFRSRLRRHLVTSANRFAFFGLTFLLGAMGSAILLILRVVIGSGLAIAISVTVITWCVLIWFAVPAWWRYRHRECGSEWHELAAGQEAPDRPTVLVGDVQRPPLRAAPVMEMAWIRPEDGLRARWRMHYVVRRSGGDARVLTGRRGTLD